jgi:hypothetical protein
MMVLENAADVFNKYRVEQLMQEAAHERLVREARAGEESYVEPARPAYCCITGDGKGNFVLQMEAAETCRPR